MVKYLFLSLFLLTSCNFWSQNLQKPDALMYDEYLEYLQIAAGSKNDVKNAFDGNLNIIYFYKDFTEVGIKFLIFYNKALNQQYAFFYDYGVEQTFTSIQKAPFVRSFNVSNATFNRDILKAFKQIESTIEPRFKSDIKKIIVGSKVGGAMANMISLSLIANSKMQAEEFEVIDFDAPHFANNLDAKFSRASIKLPQNKTVELK
jgi:hypothetical protein